MTVTLVAAILAGGKSERMGRDKAGLKIGIETLLERTARITLLSGVQRVSVVGRVQPREWSLATVDFVPDSPGLSGPLAGLKAALQWAGGSAVLLLACDMPALTEAAIEWLAAQAASRELKDGLAVVNGFQVEPLFSVYSSRCLDTLEAQVRAADLSLQSLIRSTRFVYASAPDWVSKAIVNVNTPSDLLSLGVEPDAHA